MIANKRDDNRVDFAVIGKEKDQLSQKAKRSFPFYGPWKRFLKYRVLFSQVFHINPCETGDRRVSVINGIWLLRFQFLFPGKIFVCNLFKNDIP